MDLLFYPPLGADNNGAPTMRRPAKVEDDHTAACVMIGGGGSNAISPSILLAQREAMEAAGRSNVSSFANRMGGGRHHTSPYINTAATAGGSGGNGTHLSNVNGRGTATVADESDIRHLLRLLTLSVVLVMLLVGTLVWARGGRSIWVPEDLATDAN